MPRRHGEITDQDLDRAWEVLHSARSLEELRDRIETTPALRSPLSRAA